MRKILFTIIISQLYPFFIFSQDIHRIKAYSDQQFFNGNYQIALKEYQRVLFFDTELEYTDIYRKIAFVFYFQQDFEDALKYYNLAWNIEQNDSIRNELIFHKSICHFKLNNYFQGLNELLDLPGNSSAYFQYKRNLFLGICYYGLNDYQTSLDYFSVILDSTGIQQISSVFTNFEKFNKKFNPRKIEIMSLIFPGLGQLYCGEPGSGLNSFFLLSGIVVYGFYTMANYGFLDGFFVLSSWFYRYYTGGSGNAAYIAQLKINNKKSSDYSEIIKIIENHKCNPHRSFLLPH